MEITVIGAGLAGVEAANAITRYGIKVRLYEMKPRKFSPAHKQEGFAELVCSNSLKSKLLTNASGLLKEEMKLFGSIVMEAAYRTQVEAGQALAVDRFLFSEYITEKIKQNPLIEIIHEEVTEIPRDEVVVVSTGPLTSESLLEDISKLCNSKNLYFFDAAAPIVLKDSIDFSKAFFASRYNRGSDDYINCPMTKEEYERFYHELVNAEVIEVKDFERDLLFEGCMPIEEMARRGIDTMRFGPLKPVGIVDPKTGRMPYAVVQLRKDTQDGRLYNMVGFQTRLKWGEQKRVFRLIPGLENAEFVRFGVMHKNSYINSPEVLTKFLSLKKYPNIFFAGQITGAEGYLESAATGIVAGINAARYVLGKPQITLPPATCIGALIEYITTPKKDFQPMNANYGIISIDDEIARIKDKEKKKLLIAERSLSLCSQIANQIFE
ncbi:methylenetetrahydrofolate--tRNA-(uracil(54)-C(5))-methyltransferase (FADH(2)-oxidizing) TrmFO [Caldicellulosiruptor morganii]|uniref:Methylenetetrahydrofolate--tRNA-(uracil-5-)-methyltransferase TrmFO n=1 Tax=Caldicellulosiruptor morganii TaxID=1387555 RepID=A0ABY7BKW2_9FIRM|nr:methylenetetrahydrofolate--tRNA-(uracil(54)-C(5))-methyltransferase (FADH(2)-oxidizing) TrmFO [Caldicellulosiruptor morganii]WAM33460.1 methylenetetrahydrofolate--tRNA-(uracil(54)-C(5))-methyltransferase (FADH(2)-oxidizing) TrmFO [Caldicellulosiruptor morganii]